MSLGRIEIKPEVIVDIIKEAITESENVIDISEKSKGLEPISMLKNIVKIKDNKSVEVELGDLECVIDLGIIIKYGVNIEETVINLQEKIKEKVERITNKRVSEINVTVNNLVKIEKEVIENV